MFLSFGLISCLFQPDAAYEGVAHKKACNIFKKKSISLTSGHPQFESFTYMSSRMYIWMYVYMQYLFKLPTRYIVLDLYAANST